MSTKYFAAKKQEDTLPAITSIKKRSANPAVNPLDGQVGGNHYCGYKIQPIEYIHANGLDFIQGCVVKYITRFRDKNGLEDLKKIKHAVDLLIELEYESDS